MRRLLLAAMAVLCTAAWAAPWQGISALAASGDGKRFATGGREGEVLVWETSTGEIQGRWLLATLPVVGLAFSPDGATLGAVTLDGTCWSLTLPDGVTVSDTKKTWKMLAEAPARALARSPALFGVALSWKDLQVKGTPEGTVTAAVLGGASVTWQAHEAAVTAAAFLPDGTLLTAGYDGTVGHWDPRTGRALGRL